MSQNDMSIANASGAVVRADLNSALQALASCSAGDTAPGTTYQGQWWLDTANNLLCIRNEANTDWVTVAQFTGTDWVPAIQTPVVEIPGTTTIGASHAHRMLRVTASAPLNLTAAATLGDGFFCFIRNDHSAAITLDASGAEQIDGSATKSLDPGAGLILICSGSAFTTIEGAKIPSGTNLGSSGGRVFSSVSGGSLQFRRIVAGANITVTENTNDLTIAASGVGSATVGQSQLKTATSEVSVLSTAIGDSAPLNSTFSGGEYGFWPVSKASGGAGSTLTEWRVIPGGYGNSSVSGTYTNRVTILATHSGSNGFTVFGQQRYITSSPPYDWGDGELVGFAFLKVEKSSGLVLAGWTAQDPPWAYNGPTRTKADVFFDPFGIPIGLWEALGKGTKVIPAIKTRRTTESFAAAKAGGRLARHVDELAHGDETYEAVTMARKMRDMNVVPHPFFDLKSTETVVLLDPLCAFTADLFAAAGGLEANGESILSLVHAGDIRFDNEDLAVAQKRGGPRGVMQVACRLR